jgi:threonine synthase
MNPITYYSTNNPSERANFETALLVGQPKDYGLYMIARKDLPKFSSSQIRDMQDMSYAEIAFHVLNPFLSSEIVPAKLKELLNDAYREDKIPTKVQHVTGRTYIMWLTQGPTYSFKDYAARFYGRLLNYFLQQRGLRRTVVVATSGDTGGAVADALHGLDNIDNIVFYPKGEISEGQRRQMTTLGGNVYAFEVDGDFDVCQALAKNILGDKDFAKEVYGDPQRLTSANSISIGRLLPQSVYPFFAYSRIAKEGKSMIASIPSGNFGDMMGTVLAKEMGLPVSKILCGVNENTEFPDFLQTGEYHVGPSKKSPSSAMIVSHPSNLARLMDFYGGHMFDERDQMTRRVIREGVIDKMPNLTKMREDIFSIGVNNPQHYQTMKEVFEAHKIVLDPHGAVGWRTLEVFNGGNYSQLAVIYETADPGKFPDDVQKAIGVTPELPKGMKKQTELKERIYSIKTKPDVKEGALKLSDAQIKEAKEKIREIILLCRN